MGLDVLLVYVAFRLSYRQARAAEEIRLTRSELTVRRVAADGRSAATGLNPYWARLEIDRHPEFGILRMTIAWQNHRPRRRHVPRAEGARGLRAGVLGGAQRRPRRQGALTRKKRVVPVGRAAYFRGRNRSQRHGTCGHRDDSVAESFPGSGLGLRDRPPRHRVHLRRVARAALAGAHRRRGRAEAAVAAAALHPAGPGSAPRASCRR